MFGRFQLVPRTQEGKVFPPLMTVTYTDVLITDLNTQTVAVSGSHTRTLLSLCFHLKLNFDDYT